METLQRRKERLDVLFREHSGRVLGYALNRGMSLDQAEDVVSDTYLVCWRRLDDVPADAFPWLLGTARKIMANHRRSDRRRDALGGRMVNDFVSASHQLSDPVETVLGRTHLAEALDQLSERDREAILLVAWDGLSNAEAARVVDCSRSTFAVRAFRARSRLLKYLSSIRTYTPSEADVSEVEAS
jgi:RNA polymerase sigma factor (sigma-70 family)